MPVLRKRRKFPHVDMTAMCDVAFLLLVFVMFIGRPRDITAPVDVKPPTIHRFFISDPDGDYLTVYVKNSKIYLGFESIPWLKQQTLLAMATESSINFTIKELDKFGRIGNFGDSMPELKGFIEDYGTFYERKHLKGIPINDTKNNEFFKWISTARSVYNKHTGRELRVNIRGEQDEKYPFIKLIIANLQRQDINTFGLITQYISEKD